MVFSTLFKGSGYIIGCMDWNAFRYFSFPGIIIEFGTEISAYFHAYTNVYITKKLYKKGR